MSSNLSTKRIEIVVEAEKLEELICLLIEAGTKGYTVIKKVGGLGLRGTRNPDDALWDEGNTFVTLACKEDQVVRIVQGLSPWLKKFGGMCLISDCERLESPAVPY
ncbi:P-II family nitrogen regulator [Nitrosomonas sp.]|uniref:P-II family nitrogen regulator n=1 Tax=Nitrosomonas sp. TaxID=42353 RepID=UPI0028502DD3|nr:transcriptional regulator [Nitrosomonas sp.]MCP5242485.1 transcriptional regulator [Burkholderiales bacterium]MDR4515310.1 transcriptional regulator [Nitrosomonas sp.]